MRNSTPEQRKRWNKTYYERNKEVRREQYQKWKNDLRDWYRELKSSLCCERCGFNHPAAIQFHHRNSDEKLSSISEMVVRGVGRERILEEISKCDVICANCHAIEHWRDD